MAKTEAQYDAQIKSLENNIKATRPDVKWVNAEQYAAGIIDRKFFGHAKVNKQSVVKNPPPQPSQLGKDGFYTNVQNCEGKL